MKVERKFPYGPVLLAFFAISVLALLVFYDSGSPCWKPWREFLGAGCVSILAGVLLSFFVDVPKKMEEYTRLISTSLTSYEYLKSLSQKELFDLRGRVTSELYAKNSPKLPKGLIHLDNKVCSLLENPYYKFYRESIHCSTPHKINMGLEHNTATNSSSANALFVEKNIEQNYEIKCPHSGEKLTSINVGMRNFMYLPADCKLNQMLRIDSFLVAIDGSKAVDILPLLNVVYHRFSRNDGVAPDYVPYNTCFQLSTENDSPITKEALLGVDSSKKIDYKEGESSVEDASIMVSFHDCIVVKLAYTITVPAEDNLFVKRLRYSAESYRLDYSIEDKTKRLTGQLFGTLLDQTKKILTETNDDRQISVESLEWLLPQSGVFVVASERNESSLSNSKEA